jgi:hypothetical protein
MMPRIAQTAAFFCSMCPTWQCRDAPILARVHTARTRAAAVVLFLLGSGEEERHHTAAARGRRACSDGGRLQFMPHHATPCHVVRRRRPAAVHATHRRLLLVRHATSCHTMPHHVAVDCDWHYYYGHVMSRHTMP